MFGPLRRRYDRLVVLATDHGWLWPPLAVALVIRTWNLREQILIDDELHAVFHAMSDSLVQILTHFGEADYCIPLTTYLWLAAHTIGLSEWVVQLPVLAAGAGLCIVLPMAIRRVDPVAGAAAAWILALSPLHVFMSRFGRPYGIVMLLTFVAAVAVWRLLDARETRRWTIVLVASAILAPYFHLTALPAIASILLVFVIRRWGRAGAGSALRVVAIVGAGWTAVLGAPIAIDRASLTKQGAMPTFQASAWLGSLEMLVGTPWPWLAIVLLACAVLGWVRVVRTAPMLALILLAPAVAQVLVLIVTRPVLGDLPHVMSRYCFCALPVLVTGLAFALAGVTGRASGVRRAVGSTVAAVVGVVVVLTGPLPPTMRPGNAWTTHGWYQYFYRFNDPMAQRSWEALRPAIVPAFFTELAMRPPNSVLLVEAPWLWITWRNPYPIYQEIHRQRTKMGFVGSCASDHPYGEIPQPKRGLAFRNFVNITDKRRLAKMKADYLVLHKQLYRDVPGLRNVKDAAVDLTTCIARIRAVHGAPVFEDDSVVVFALHR